MLKDTPVDLELRDYPWSAVSVLRPPFLEFSFVKAHRASIPLDVLGKD